jgi:hypothetical protein
VARFLGMIGLTLLALVALDAGVAGLLGAMRVARGEGGLVRYFEYGRSVPGKLAHWIDRPEDPGNLFDVAWRPDILAASAEGFRREDPAVPVVRAYGMSFVGHVLDAAAAQAPGLPVDLHAGPEAPPNFTYALFLDDRANRRPGDAVVLGILSSAVPAMAALSNRSWAFEQPAPFTYPVFLPAPGGGLRRINPLVNTAPEERAAMADPALGAAWSAQLARVDGFRTAAAFDLPVLDASPFVRQVRRALALGSIRRRQQALEAGGFPYREVLARIVRSFVETARADGQIPLVMLIQSADPADPDVLEMVKPVLNELGAPYLATRDLADPHDPSNFVPDGHYTAEANARFGTAFLDLMSRSRLARTPARTRFAGDG